MNLMQRLESLSRAAVPVVGLGGDAGSILEVGTSTHSGEFKAIQVLAEATFDSATTGNMENLSGATISAGQVLHGLWTMVKITSGAVIIYRC